jgi:zinc D-Ala-D-Ala carboxypeptidase
LQLTDHFADTELGVAGCSPLLVANARALCVEILEPLRTKFGPVLVHDGYRDPGHNARVGGKAASFHLYDGGKAAADISCASVANKTIFDWLRLESGLPFDKVILEYNPQGFAATVHIQIDTANSPRRQAYTGSTGAGTVYTPQQVLP